MNCFKTTDGELSLPEMLADSIVQTMMDNDGVTKEEVTGILRAMHERMASRAAELNKTISAQGAWRTDTRPCEKQPSRRVITTTPTSFPRPSMPAT